MSTPTQPTKPAATSGKGKAGEPASASPASSSGEPSAVPALDDLRAATPVADGPAAEVVDGAEAGPEKRRRGRPKGSTTARTTRTIELILTVSGTADGDWQAELKQGSTWLQRGLPVTATAVLRAAQELHPELAEPIDAVIGAAREQRAARVAALEAELEQARKALAEIED